MTETATTTTNLPSTDSPAPVSWFEVHTADVDRAKTFYGGVFGWSFDDSMPGYTMVDLGAGAPHGGGIVGTNGEYPSGALFNIQVPDVAAALAAVEATGGSVVMPLQTMDMGLVFAYATDPDGSIFGLWTPPAG